MDTEENEKEVEVKNGPKTWKDWSQEIERAKTYHAEYHERAKRTLEEYRQDPSGTGKSESKKANIYYATIEAVKPSIFSSTPLPDIRRRKAATDKIARLSAEIWERTVSYSLDCSQNSYYVFERARDDYLLPGRPVLWERYEADIQEVTEPYPVTEEDIAAGFVTIGDEQYELTEENVSQDEQGALSAMITYEKTVSEKSITDYVHYLDFLHNGARTEDEIRWKGRCHYLTKEKLEEKFGEAFKRWFKKDIEEAVATEKSPEHGSDKDAGKEENKKYKTAAVWEIWDSVTRAIYYWTDGFKGGCLDVIPAPDYIEGFFPCATSIVACSTNDSVLPIPEYCMVRDQCIQINNLTSRIERLEDRIRANGAFPSQYSALAKLATANDQLIPIPGLPSGTVDKNLITWAPIEIYTQALDGLYQARDREIQLFYQITRYSDLMRGVSDPRETAAAQNAKVQYGNTSLQQKQRDFQQFIRDQIRIKAAIIAEKFSPETFRLAAGDLNEPVTDQEFDQAIQLLRDEYRRNYVIEIETDSTIAPDEAREKEAINEFMASVPNFMQSALQFAQATPGMMVPMVELIKGLIRRYKFGRGIEAAFEAGIQQLQQSLQQQAQQPPQMPPEVQAQMLLGQAEMQKAQNQGQKDQMDYQLDTQKLQAENQAKMAELQTKQATDAENIKLKWAELQIRGRELDLQQQQLAIEAQKLGLDAQKATADLNFKGFDLARQVKADETKAAIEAAKIRQKEKESSLIVAA